jgi:RHS repeat-associated protein
LSKYSLQLRSFTLREELEYVEDAVSSTNYDVDIDEQSNDNYIYDEIGNLINDNSEDLEISWFNNGKIKEIYNSKNNTYIRFRYDPMGNRISKEYITYENVTKMYYIRDAQSNVLAIYEWKEDGEDTLRLKEFDIYGSDRLGLLLDNTILYTTQGGVVPTPEPPAEDEEVQHVVGNKLYELKNHLRNVMAVISDKKFAGLVGFDVYWYPDIKTVQDFYPFGMIQPERTWESDKYRYGFGSHEKDDEVKGVGNHISFGEYGYDARLGRRWNKDPITFSWQGSYNAFNNNPIMFVDPTGHGAEVTAEHDKNGKVTSINVKAKVYVHGEGSDRAVALIQKDIEDHLRNNPELKGTWGGSRTVPVNFDITVESVNDDQLAQRRREHETDKSINIVQMSDISSYDGGGMFQISLDNMQRRGNTFTHELFHMLGFNSGDKNDPSHFPDFKEGSPIPIMYSGREVRNLLHLRVVTPQDIKGLRNRQGLNFAISPEKTNATRVIEYPHPAGSNPYSKGEWYKK